MNKKLAISLGPLLAIAALAAMPVAAQAGTIPHWYSEGKLITNETVHVKTSGTLTFFLTQYDVKITCKVTDEETITNPPSGGPGTDDLISLKLSGCKPVKGEANICSPGTTEVIWLPPTTHTPYSYLAVEPPAKGVRDVLEFGAFEFKCSTGTALGVFTGSLNPKVGSSVLNFNGGTALSGPNGTVTVTGKDKLIGPEGDRKITAH